MTEPERETAGAVRSANVAHFFAPDWAQTAQRAIGALERTDREVAATQVLVIVPDAAAAQAVARELRATAASTGLRVLPVTSASRAARVLKSAPAQVVVGSPTALAEMLHDSSLKLDAVHTAVLASADELDSASEALGALMAELPRGGSRILTASEPTPLVESLLERYLHKARRVVAPALQPLPLDPGTPPTIYVRTVAAGQTFAPLAELLDDLDPPSAVIVVTDAKDEGRAHSALEALGYPADSNLIRVSRTDVTLHTALVLFAGLPDAGAISAAFGAHPARMVALVTARQRAALAKAAGGAVLMPYEHSRASRSAKVKEDAMRATIRNSLATGLPQREVLALEPLLAEFDGLEIAAAALRLYERAQSEVATARLAGRDEVKKEMKAKAAAEAPAAAPAARDDRPPRSGSTRGGERPPRRDDARSDRGDRPSGPPRGDRPSGPPRSFGGPDRGERPERSFGGPPRGERPERSFGGPPRGERPERSFGGPPRGERPERSFGGPPRGDRPFTRGPRDDRKSDGPRSGGRGPGVRGAARDGGRPPRRDK